MLKQVRKTHNRSKHSFTLVELIVVLVILAVLAAMLVPALTGYIKRTKKEKYIEMEFLCEFPENALPLKTLKEHGLGQVQIQARTDRRLQMFLDEVERKTVANGGENK